jgi:hypothetical protein
VNREAPAIETPPYFGPAHRPNDRMIRVFQEIWLRLPPLPMRFTKLEAL